MRAKNDYILIGSIKHPYSTDCGQFKWGQDIVGRVSPLKSLKFRMNYSTFLGVYVREITFRTFVTAAPDMSLVMSWGHFFLTLRALYHGRGF